MLIYIIPSNEITFISNEEEIQGETALVDNPLQSKSVLNSFSEQAKNCEEGETSSAQIDSVPSKVKQECEICNKKLSNIHSLLAHQKRCHPVYWNLHKERFLTHQKKVKIEKQEKNIECDICHKFFLRRTTLLKHKRMIHKILQSAYKTSSGYVKRYSCHICDKSFTNLPNCRIHLRTRHGITPFYKKYMTCSECFKIFRNKELLISHLEQFHNIVIEIKTHEFQCDQDFEKWKKDMENYTAALYVVQYAGKTKEGFQTVNYTCHCNGNSESTEMQETECVGTNKIQYFCPAFISLQSKQAAKLYPAEIKFTCTHMGH